MGENRAASAVGATNQEVLIEFYGEFNTAVTSLDDDDELAETFHRNISWETVTAGDRTEATYTGIDAVIEQIVSSVRETTDHLQALPERVIDAGETVVVEGAYVGTIDETSFDTPFVHIFELEEGLIHHCRAYAESPIEGATLVHADAVDQRPPRN
ncbi:nuclear transport factor 2 family protein [Natronorubrum daqingense]|uniref:SnoaL-like domain-containing protein n=1 Tax=Natronorubrum daqingense TaxID=588898 RepID=A0A1N6YW15_9EURY|nr:nuclear transport factor 2 family protein [Natronorubrum daqingense]APX95545.1 hypothetical protein BB347_02350 [Natronorubrum daqingense]SIR18823.1 hypothetical protein SAMN05421809_0579 [Natronorubrum daqingense]